MTDAATAVDAEPILRLRGVGRRYGGLHAVRDVDLDVAHGERRAILGPNGAGKTTLFNVISGDVPPSSGTIEFLGAEISMLPPRARTKLGMGRTYQKSRSFLGLTVEDNVYLALLGFSLAAVGVYSSLPLFWMFPMSVLTGSAAAGGLALINSIGNLSGLVGPTLIGWLKDHTQGFTAGLLIIAGSMAFAAAFGFVLSKTMSKSAGFERHGAGGA